MKYEKDLEQTLDTRKEYVIVLILSIIGVGISVYITNLRLITLFSLVVFLLTIFKKDLYLHYLVRYRKLEIIPPS